MSGWILAALVLGTIGLTLSICCLIYDIMNGGSK